MVPSSTLPRGNERTRRAHNAALVIIAVCGLIAAYASVSLSGTKTGLILGLLVTIGPALMYAALTSPIAFPFCAYVFLSPFDSILDIPGSGFGTATRLIGAATAAALVFYMLRTKRAVEPPRSTAFWLLLLLWMAASMAWAIDVPSTQALLPTSVQLLGLYIVVSMMRVDLKQLRYVAIAAAAGGVVSALYGIFMYHNGEGIFKDRLYIHTDTSALNPDHFAASLLLPAAICLIAALWSRSLFTKAASACGLLAMLINIDLTGARGPMLGLLGLFVYLIVRDRHRKILMIAAGALAALAVVIAGPQSFLDRWSSAASTGGAGRTDIWHVGLLAFKQNWLVGAGYGNFPFAYDKAFIQVFQPVFENWHRASHNILLNTGVELGVVGLTLLLLAWWNEFRLLRHIGPADIRFPIKTALEGSMIALFISGMFADIMIWKYVWVAFMLVVLTRNAIIPAAAPQVRAQEVAPQHA